MRNLCLILFGAALAGCTSVPPSPERSAAAELRLQQLLAGKVAGKARSCLPSDSSRDMVVIDDDTVLFREGGRRVWRTELPHACPQLASGHYALVTRSYGGQGMCRGDIVALADTSSGTTVGSCVWGDSVLYTGARR